MKDRMNYIRTDMASECHSEHSGKELSGLNIREEKMSGFDVSYLDITDKETEDILKKPKGRYVTINIGKIWLETDKRRDDAVSLIGNELHSLISSLCGKAESALVVGLGNRYIISDAIGPMTVKGLIVNRHIKEHDPILFKKFGSLPLSAIAPGVTGQTGIEALDIVKGAVSAVEPSVVIVIDALAARDVERLGTTVQLSNTGIAPGSGIGNRRRAIDKNTLGVPVISIGVPTVVDSSTLVFGMLEKAGINELSPSLESELNNGRSFFVTLKDTDTVINEMSSLISDAVHFAVSINE